MKHTTLTAPLLGVAWLASLARLGVALAQPAPGVVVALEYSAPADCPDAAGFRDQVLGRTHRMRFADAGTQAALTWSVSVIESGSGKRGTLRVTGSGSGNLARSVTATSCEQVVSALGLVAALSVDPEASLTAPEKSPAAQPAGTPSSSPPRPPPAAPVGSSRVEPRAGATRLSVGLTLTGRSGVAPKVAWAPRPFVGISFRSASGYTWGLGLSAMQTHGNAAVNIGRADFTWSTARLEAFPVRLAYGRMRFEPALFIEGGQLRARGVAITPAAEVHRPALLAGGLGRLSFLAVDLLLLQLEAGPLVPVLRDRFYLRENTTVFRIPTVTAFVAAGVGIEFL